MKYMLNGSSSCATLERGNSTTAYITGTDPDEPWTTASAGYSDIDDGFDVDKIMRDDPIFRAEIHRKLDEARIAREEGRVTPHKEAMSNFWRKVENGLL